MDNIIEKTIWLQPIETDVKVENKINAKGESQPELSIKISRKLENKEEVFQIITKDIEEAVKKVKEEMEKLKWI